MRYEELRNDGKPELFPTFLVSIYDPFLRQWIINAVVQQGKVYGALFSRDTAYEKEKAIRLSANNLSSVVWRIFLVGEKRILFSSFGSI